MVLRQIGEDVELLLIERATRDDDPWSGHMAFPGGRRDPQDSDVVHTALRETREEVGIDLVEDAEIVGRLDEIRASARHRPQDLIISPVVCALRNAVELELEPREVESAIWVPVSFLLSPGARAAYRRSFGGKEMEFPAYRYERYTVWGLTHRILEGFLDLVTEQVAADRAAR